MVELIPGTALPLHVGPGGQQGEGRQSIGITRERAPVAMTEGENVDGLDPRTLALVERMITRYDAAAKRVTKTIFGSAGGVTDATTGNLVVPLFTTPQGMDGRLTYCTVDAPLSVTINPTAPFASGSAFIYLSISASSSGDSAANATTYRGGMVAFAPTSAGGPMIPGQWTFNIDQAPVVQGNESIHFICSGGSVAAIKAVTLRVKYRIELAGANA